MAAFKDGKLASGSYDKTIIIWNVTTSKILKHLKGHTDWIISLVVLSNQINLASGGWDKKIIIWKVNMRFEQNNDHFENITIKYEELFSHYHDSPVRDNN